MKKRDLDLLLYPLIDHSDPLCADCQVGMEVLTFEACGKAVASDVATFQCRAVVDLNGIY